MGRRERIEGRFIEGLGVSPVFLRFGLLLLLLLLLLPLLLVLERVTRVRWDQLALLLLLLLKVLKLLELLRWWRRLAGDPDTQPSTPLRSLLVVIGRRRRRQWLAVPRGRSWRGRPTREGGGD